MIVTIPEAIISLLTTIAMPDFYKTYKYQNSQDNQQKKVQS